MNKTVKILIIILVLINIASCQKSEKDVVIKEEITISETWMRPGIQNRNSASFMKIRNNTNSPDTLISVSSDLAKKTELHETFEKANDMKGMRHIEMLPIPAHSTVELKPGSYHVMLIGLNNDLKVGDPGKIELNFKSAGSLAVDVTVK